MKNPENAGFDPDMTDLGEYIYTCPVCEATIKIVGPKKTLREEPHTCSICQAKESGLWDKIIRQNEEKNIKEK